MPTLALLPCVTNPTSNPKPVDQQEASMEQKSHLALGQSMPVERPGQAPEDSDPDSRRRRHRREGGVGKSLLCCDASRPVDGPTSERTIRYVLSRISIVSGST